MEVNLGYIYDILSFMIEAQYWDETVPEDNLGFIEDYQERTDSQRNDEGAKNFRKGLREVLKAILNKPNINYEEIFLNGAMHGTGSQDRAKKIFGLIWCSFFGNKDWHDTDFSTDEIVLVNKPFIG